MGLLLSLLYVSFLLSLTITISDFFIDFSLGFWSGPFGVRYDNLIFFIDPPGCDPLALLTEFESDTLFREIVL